MKIKKSELNELKKKARNSFSKSRKASKRKATSSTVTDVKDNYSFSKFLKGVHTGQWDEGSTEQRYFKKALEQDNEVKGGILVPTETSSEIIERLVNTAVVRTMPNVRILDMERDKMEIARIEDGPTTSWGGELETIDENDDIRFGAISLELKKNVIIYQISRELLMNANTSVDDIVIEEIAKEMAEEEDRVLLEGTGGPQPLGIYNNSQVSKLPVNGVVTFDHVTSAMYEVERKNLNINGWIGNHRDRQILRTIKDSDGRALLTHPSTAEGVKVDELYGNTAKWTNKVSKTLGSGSNESYMVGGDWSQLMIGQKPGLRIETTQEGGDAFAKDSVLIKVVRYIDATLRHPEGFTMLTGLKTS